MQATQESPTLYGILCKHGYQCNTELSWTPLTQVWWKLDYVCAEQLIAVGTNHAQNLQHFTASLLSIAFNVTLNLVGLL